MSGPGFPELGPYASSAPCCKDGVSVSSRLILNHLCKIISTMILWECYLFLDVTAFSKVKVKIFYMRGFVYFNF